MAKLVPYQDTHQRPPNLSLGYYPLSHPFFYCTHWVTFNPLSNSADPLSLQHGLAVAVGVEFADTVHYIFLLWHLIVLFNQPLSLRLVGAVGARNYVKNSFSK